MKLKKNVVEADIKSNGGEIIIGDNNFIIKVLKNNTSEDYRNNLQIVKQTNNVLNKIQVGIGGFSIKRDLGVGDIKDKLQETQYLFIEGGPGYGKSVYSKQLLKKLDDTCIISFMADQFLENSLITTLKNVGISTGIREIFDDFKNFSNKLIYIDSFEKLLEGEGEAFRELLFELRQTPDIRVILSCRDYALDTLIFNFFDNSRDTLDKIIVPALKKEELDFFIEKLPHLKSISTNEKLSEILCVPKYLSLAEKLVAKSNKDFSSINEPSFKIELWKHIVESTITKNAINERRGKTFVDVSIKRARELSILTNVENLDLEAIGELKADGILYSKNNLCAPSHDIFEDWGLIKYIDNHKIQYPNTHNFFRDLGNEPAVRRAFRLWIESKIQESNSWIYNFIDEALNEKGILNHWKDEILTSIVKSKYCGKYFDENNTNLLGNELDLLKRFIHLLRVSGKDSNNCPNNSGWDVVIEFIHNQIDILNEVYPLILRFLFEWEPILYRGKELDNDTPKYVGQILIKILDNFDEGVSWMNRGESSSLKEKGVKLLYQLPKYVRGETKTVLDELIANKGQNKNNNLSNKKAEYALSHFYSGKLPEYFPDHLIELANMNWKAVKKKDRHSYSSHEIEQYFGLATKYDFKYFPESAYQTFVYKLLCHHPGKALNFIIDLVNYTVQNYMDSDFLEGNDEIKLVELEYDGKIFNLHGSNYLWSINRGGQYTVPDLLQSVVVALERYLFELGKYHPDTAGKYYEIFFDKIYRKSNSVILISVIASIVMAYPEKVGDKFLPLLMNKELYDWDRSRWMQEQSAGALLGLPSASGISTLCNEERKEALDWGHRLKYIHGLAGFILDYQFKIRKHNDEIHQIFDALKEKISKEDLLVKKWLFEIDARNWKDIKEVKNDKKQVAFEIRPDYSKETELKNMIVDIDKSSKSVNECSRYSLIISKAFGKNANKEITYQEWKECYNYFVKQDFSDMELFLPFPVATMSVLGIDLFSEELSKKELFFCKTKIFEIGAKLYEDNRKPYDFENTDFSISIYDKKAIFYFLPKMLLFKRHFTKKEIDDIQSLIFLILRDVGKDRTIDIDSFYNSFKTWFWDIDFDFAHKCFVSIVLYAELNKKYPRAYDLSDKEITAVQDEEKKILEFVENFEGSFNFSLLSYEKHSHYLLSKTLKIFPTKKVLYFTYEFLKTLYKSHINSFSYGRSKYHSTEFLDIGNEIRDLLAESMLSLPLNDGSISLFNQILNTSTSIPDSPHKNRSLIEYQGELIQGFYYYIDRNSDDNNKIENFWKYWNLLFEHIQNDFDMFFLREFLFYSDLWKSEAEDWRVLEARDEDYLVKLKHLKRINVDAFLRLISGIGFQKLMPEGIAILTTHLKENPTDIVNIDFYFGEKLISRSFQHKKHLIKQDAILLDSFLWFLDLMIEMGSSKSYMVRENLILYKRLS